MVNFEDIFMLKAKRSPFCIRSYCLFGTSDPFRRLMMYDDCVLSIDDDG